MSEVETPVSGGDGHKGERDGVSGASDGGNVQGRTAGGESGGGGYANPQTGRKPTNSGFFGHGGQTEIGYHGGGQAGEQGGDAPNAATGSDSSDGAERGSAMWPSPVHEQHAVHAAGRSFQVVESNGVAEAEATGKVGTDSPYEREQNAPGAG